MPVICRVASMPSSSGIRTSMSTTSGLVLRVTATAAVPVPASPTTSSRRRGRDDAAEPGPYQGLVVGDHDPQAHRPAREAPGWRSALSGERFSGERFSGTPVWPALGCAGSGKWADTRKPCPGTGPALNSPPHRLTRSRMPMIP